MIDINSDTTLHVVAHNGRVFLEAFLPSEEPDAAVAVTIELSPEAAHKLSLDLMGKAGTAAMQARVEELRKGGRQI